MQKLSQTEELARTLAAHARRKTLTPDQISRAMDEADYDVARLDELYEALEARGVHIAEDEEAELPPLDETQLGQLEHELSAEGVALDEKKFWQRLQSSMELNGNRKVLMRNIWMSITSRKKNGKRKYRNWSRRKSI